MWIWHYACMSHVFKNVNSYLKPLADLRTQLPASIKFVKTADYYARNPNAHMMPNGGVELLRLHYFLMFPVESVHPGGQV